MKTYIPYITSNDAVSVYLDECYIIPRSHLLFGQVMTAVKNGDLKGLQALISQKNATGIQVIGDEVRYNGKVLSNSATEKLFQIKAAGFDIQPMIKFLENCFQNPHPKVIEGLYDFLSAKGMPLTEDGCFLGYKFVKLDYWDDWTGKTVQYLPGTTVSVERDSEADYSGEECSSKGLHVGNHAYSGVVRDPNKRYLIVKVNPKDVVSVPTNGHRTGAQKIRTWEMFVVKEINSSTEMFVQPVANNSGGQILNLRKNARLDCIYKDGDGIQATYHGTIKNVGPIYLELDQNWRCSDPNKTSRYKTVISNGGTKITSKIRLKINNILETL